MRNKMIISGIAMMAGISACGVVQEANACGLGVATFEVTATSLNVRPEPNTSKPSIATLKKGQKVVPFEKLGNWGKIKLPNKTTGWVSLTYLKEVSKCNIPDTDVESTTVKRVVVNTDGLNLREKPTTNSASMTKFKKGKELTLLKQEGAWSFVEDGHVDGWVYTKYIDAVKENSTTNNNSTTWTGIVTGTGIEGLNVRMDAGVQYSIKTVLPEGSEVEVQYEVVRNNGTWLRIKYKAKNGNDYGYVAKSYIKEKSNANQTQPSAPVETQKPSTESTNTSVSVDNELTGAVYDEETGALRWFERTVYAPAGDPLNIRVAPNSKSEIITKTVRYSKIFVAGESKTNPGWYKVTGVDYNGKSYTGWAISKYIF